MHDSIAASSYSPRCPFCEVGEHSGHDSARCLACKGFFSEGLLEALRRMVESPGSPRVLPTGAKGRESGRKQTA